MTEAQGTAGVLAIVGLAVMLAVSALMVVFTGELADKVGRALGGGRCC